MSTPAWSIWPLALVCASAIASEPQIGQTLPPEPAGLVSTSQMCVPVPNAPECQWGLSALADAKAFEQAQKNHAPASPDLWLLAQRQQSPGSWRVTDVVKLPAMASDEGLQLAGCVLGDKSGSDRPGASTIVAIAKITDTEYYTQIRHAWQFNASTGQFESVPTKGIRCLNDGWAV